MMLRRSKVNISLVYIHINFGEINQAALESTRVPEKKKFSISIPSRKSATPCNRTVLNDICPTRQTYIRSVYNSFKILGEKGTALSPVSITSFLNVVRVGNPFQIWLKYPVLSATLGNNLCGKICKLLVLK
jgi:hypothetical protein